MEEVEAAGREVLDGVALEKESQKHKAASQGWDGTDRNRGLHASQAGGWSQGRGTGDIPQQEGGQDRPCSGKDRNGLQ